MSSITSLRVSNTPSQNLAFTNRVYLNPADFNALKVAAGDNVNISDVDPAINVIFGGAASLGNTNTWVFLASPHQSVALSEVGMNLLQRKNGGYTLNQSVPVVVFIPTAEVAVAEVVINLDLLKKGGTGPPLILESEELSNSFKSQFGNQVFNCGQQLAMDFNGTKLDIIVESFEHATIGVAKHTSTNSIKGQILQVTNISWKKNPSSKYAINIRGGAGAGRNDSLFKSDFNFEQMGIGGLGAEFNTIFRRAFASRIFPGLVKQLGINHVRGILLYGPPGCGKTLIARKIGQVLNAREPKIINGPEVLNKYVGGSEEKIRELFADAEKEQAEAGDASMLHIIIFDEMDAIMKTRGSTNDSTGVSDSIVNQLLSKIDGVDSLNNILIIGMTNRKDMIDEAILRPGRLELHVEIGLADEVGRLQIIKIQTNQMKTSGKLHPEVIERLPELAQSTKNFTGAEIEGLVRSAASFALSRNIDLAKLGSQKVDPNSIFVEWGDFERALGEIVPAFGNKNADVLRAHYRNGIFDYGPTFTDLWNTLERLVNQTRTSSKTPLLTVLLEGPVFSGKTALAAKVCSDSQFPFVRMISADTMIGFGEYQKSQTILRTFTDAYKSSLSIIFIDDIERIIDFSPIGPRYSNTVLQTLLVLLRKVPQEENHRLLVIATTSIAHLLESLQLVQSFQVTLNVSQLQRASEAALVLRLSGLSAGEVNTIVNEALVKDYVTAKSNADEEDATTRLTRSYGSSSSALDKKDPPINPIGIKQLLIVLEMARSGEEDVVTPERFLECLHTCGSGGF